MLVTKAEGDDNTISQKITETEIRLCFENDLIEVKG